MLQLESRQLSLDEIEAVYRIVCRKVQEGFLDEMETSAIRRSIQEILSSPNCPNSISISLRRLMPKTKIDLDSEIIADSPIDSVSDEETRHSDQSDIPTLIIVKEPTTKPKPKALFFRQVKIGTKVTLEEGGVTYQKISNTTLINDAKEKVSPTPNEVVYCYQDYSAFSCIKT